MLSICSAAIRELAGDSVFTINAAANLSPSQHRLSISSKLGKQRIPEL